MATITGTNGNDPNLQGTNAVDQISGLGGNDRLIGLAGNDTLIGGEGNDTLEGGAGADELFGSSGFDFASYASSGSSVHIELAAFSFLGGHAAGDQLYSIEGVIGSAFNDHIEGDDYGNVLRGLAGNDYLYGRTGNDTLEGGGGNDYLAGGAGDDELRGNAGIDTADFSDSQTSRVVADLANGTAYRAGLDADRLFGIENLIGTLGNDGLYGNDGANVLRGGYGADVLIGRGGADKFDYNYKSDSFGSNARDLIYDFSQAQGDKIDLADIDAKVHATGNQAFTFIGQGQFTGEGQVRSYQQNSDTFVEVNTDNAVPGADMVIVLADEVSLQASDFLL